MSAGTTSAAAAPDADERFYSRAVSQAAPPAPAQAASFGTVAALGIAQIVSWGSLYYAFSFLITPLMRGDRWRQADRVRRVLAGPAGQRAAVRPGRRPDRPQGRARGDDGGIARRRGPARVAVSAWSRSSRCTPLGRPRRGDGGHAVRPRVRRDHAPVLGQLSTRHHLADAVRRLCQHGVLAADAVPDRRDWLAPGAAGAGRAQPGRVRAGALVGAFAAQRRPRRRPVAPAGPGAFHRGAAHARVLPAHARVHRQRAGVLRDTGAPDVDAAGQATVGCIRRRWSAR